MLGVDVCDQLIASLRPKIRCRRLWWVPIMLHCLDVLCINSYIHEPTNRQYGSHKAFHIEFVNILLQRAAAEELNKNYIIAVA